MDAAYGVWVRHEGRQAYVRWWPPTQRLHYAELCCGIYEFLRLPPGVEHLREATQYLNVLSQTPQAPMQPDRILWTREWIRAAKIAAFVG